jgi:nanoRNase/pAp phosphatase (c-di-AMP/oligoRNAs hydrolase)
MTESTVTPRDIMKVITSHERTDMDALAAMYAASLALP